MRGWSGPDHAWRVRLSTRGCETLSAAAYMPHLTKQEYQGESSRNGEFPDVVLVGALEPVLGPRGERIPLFLKSC